MISLVGMPGSGKSTVGRHVSRHLGLAFVDTDHRIEQRIGCSIRAYFELHGEAAFRDVEAEVIEEVTRDLILVYEGGEAQIFVTPELAH